LLPLWLPHARGSPHPHLSVTSALLTLHFKKALHSKKGGLAEETNQTARLHVGGCYNSQTRAVFFLPKNVKPTLKVDTPPAAENSIDAAKDRGKTGE